MSGSSGTGAHGRPGTRVYPHPMESFRPLTLALVAIGSALGGLLRHGVTEAVVLVPGGTTTAATVAINVAGSAVAGAVVAMVSQDWPTAWTAPARYAVATGLLGGFTTFSAFSMQTLMLVQDGRWASAVLNVTASAGLAVAACGAGFAIASTAGR